MELYRSLVDSFLIDYCKNLRKRDFSTKVENFSKHRKGKREYLSDSLTSDLSNRLNLFFQSKVDIPRIMHGERQSVETLINEEALLLAKYLRDENGTWIPRVSSFPFLSVVEWVVATQKLMKDID